MAQVKLTFSQDDEVQPQVLEEAAFRSQLNCAEDDSRSLQELVEWYNDVEAAWKAEVVGPTSPAPAPEVVEDEVTDP